MWDFFGTVDVVVAKNWLKKVSDTLTEIKLDDELKLKVATRLIDKSIDESYARPIDKDPLVVPDGPITRSRAKKIKEAMARLVQSTWAEVVYSPSKASTFKKGFKGEEPALIHVIQAKEELA